MVNLASPHLVGDALRARVRRHRRHRRLPDLQGQRAHLLPGNGRRLGHDARRQPELTRTPPGASVLYSTYGLRVPATCVLYVTRGAGQLGPGEALLLRIPASGVPYVARTLTLTLTRTLLWHPRRQRPDVVAHVDRLPQAEEEAPGLLREELLATERKWRSGVAQRRAYELVSRRWVCIACYKMGCPFLFFRPPAHENQHRSAPIYRSARYVSALATASLIANSTYVSHPRRASSSVPC